MGWRELVRKRDERQALEDKDLPPSMRAAPPALSSRTWGPIVAMVITVLVMGAADDGWTSSTGWMAIVLMAGVVAALLVVIWNYRKHRPKRQRPRAPDSLEWHEGD